MFSHTYKHTRERERETRSRGRKNKLTPDVRESWSQALPGHRCAWWEEEECSQVLVRYVTSLKGVPRAGYIIWKRAPIHLTGRCDKLLGHQCISPRREPILSLLWTFYYFWWTFCSFKGSKLKKSLLISLPLIRSLIFLSAKDLGWFLGRKEICNIRAWINVCLNVLMALLKYKFSLLVKLGELLWIKLKRNCFW